MRPPRRVRLAAPVADAHGLPVHQLYPVGAVLELGELTLRIIEDGTAEVLRPSIHYRSIASDPAARWRLA